jgi:NAD(P)-dependent dehydrogenase (short-subunit alcohol dehydrogenase family)
MKTVLITGANRGLGLGFTRHYLERGCRVFACARDWDPSPDSAGMRERFGERFRPVDLDVSDEQAVAALPAALDGAMLDIAINNAGTLQDEAFGGWSAATFETALSVNCTGPALVAQALLPLLKRDSALVNIGQARAAGDYRRGHRPGLGSNPHGRRRGGTVGGRIRERRDRHHRGPRPGTGRAVPVEKG